MKRVCCQFCQFFQLPFKTPCPMGNNSKYEMGRAYTINCFVSLARKCAQLENWLKSFILDPLKSPKNENRESLRILEI